ncbi:MAG: 2-hydroxyacyl-CoA dehydratase [Acidobacteria bacterium]|nr:2-hydroxyacyl-CoA dehydratase [Acidobacteriota bacterium]
MSEEHGQRREIRSAVAYQKLMGRYYAGAKSAGKDGRKVAWITSGGPVELLHCFDVIPVYPENHGAMCGATRMSVPLCEVAEERGFSRDLCSYARGDIGSAITKGGPIGGLPRPDMLICCTNICGTVLKWYEELSRLFGCPLFILDTPFVRGTSSEHAIAYVEEQMREYVAFLETHTGKRFDEALFEEVAAKSIRSISLWREILACSEHRPAPMNCFDAFIHMAPVVTLRGTDEINVYYEQLLAEMRERVQAGISAVPEERHRLLWDNIPIWYEMSALSGLLASLGACLVADTYTSAWTFEQVDVADPMRTFALAYTEIFLNVNLERMVDKAVALAERYSAGGMIMHSNRSCKPYSLGQYDNAKAFTRRTGLPVLILEADHTDSRQYGRAQAEERIRAFVETLV